MIMSLILAAHLVSWPAKDIQVGVSIGQGSEEHLILMVSREGCSHGLKIYAGQYQDLEKALRFFQNSKICSVVDERLQNALH